MSHQLLTRGRSRRKSSASMPRTGTVPTITAVALVGPGSPNDVSVSFSAPVIVRELPSWTAAGASGGPMVQSIVSSTPTVVVLRYSGSLTGLTALVVPQGDSAVASESGHVVPPGTYAV